MNLYRNYFVSECNVKCLINQNTCIGIYKFPPKDKLLQKVKHNTSTCSWNNQL